MAFNKYDVLLFRKLTLERFPSCFTFGGADHWRTLKRFLAEPMALEEVF